MSSIIGQDTHWEKKESQNGSHRRAVWSSVTQLSMEPHFGATLQGRAVSKQTKGPISRTKNRKKAVSNLFLENGSLFRDRAFFSPNMIMKKKNGSPLKKRADFQNYSPREPFWLSFLSQCSYLCCNDLHLLHLLSFLPFEEWINVKNYLWIRSHWLWNSPNCILQHQLVSLSQSRRSITLYEIFWECIVALILDNFTDLCDHEGKRYTGGLKVTKGVLKLIFNKVINCPSRRRFIF